MPTFKRFEEIEVWNIARDFCRVIFSLSNKGKFLRDFKLKDQINASSGSVMDNIAEGFARGGNREFIQFLRIANGSACESQSQLYRALDREYITKEEFKSAYQMADRIIAMNFKLISYLHKTPIRGINYESKINHSTPKP